VRSSVRVLISPRRSYLFVPCGSTGDEADCEVGFVSGLIPRRDFTDEHDGEVGLAAELVNASGILWHYGVKIYWRFPGVSASSLRWVAEQVSKMGREPSLYLAHGIETSLVLFWSSILLRLEPFVPQPGFPLDSIRPRDKTWSAGFSKECDIMLPWPNGPNNPGEATHEPRQWIAASDRGSREPGESLTDWDFAAYSH
jgi:hypothetical protein